MKSLGALAAVLLCAAAARAASFRDEIHADKFLKGNLHAHSSESDGNIPPDAVLAWYAGHGYDFAALTDHDALTVAAAPGIVVLRGIELSSRVGRPGSTRPLHVNALCAARTAAGVKEDAAPVRVLADTIDIARKAGAGVIMVNHPNWTWVLNEKDLETTRGYDLLEIFSTHPVVASEGDARHPSVEAEWDGVLTAGRDVWGAAVDDAHDFPGAPPGVPGEPPRAPGKAWVQVWASSGSPEALCDALQRGHFYASAGAVLERLDLDEKALTISVAGWDAKTDKVEFIEKNGVVALTTTKSPARYAPSGAEDYVRARVTQSGGRRAWTQPYRLK